MAHQLTNLLNMVEGAVKQRRAVEAQLLTSAAADAKEEERGVSRPNPAPANPEGVMI